MKTIASALWHLLLSPLVSAILFFGVCPLIQHLLFHLWGLLSRLSSFAILPSDIYHSSFMVYSPLWCLLFHLWGLPLCLPAFTILSFSLFSDIYRPAFRCLPLRHPADSALPSDVCYSTFWVFLSAFRRLLFYPSPYSSTFTVLPSGVYLSAIQRILRSPPMSAILFFGVYPPYPMFAVPSFIICYSPFRHLLFRLRRCRLLFSFCGHSFKNPPTYAHA